MITVSRAQVQIDRLTELVGKVIAQRIRREGFHLYQADRLSEYAELRAYEAFQWEDRP